MGSSTWNTELVLLCFLVHCCCPATRCLKILPAQVPPALLPFISLRLDCWDFLILFFSSDVLLWVTEPQYMKTEELSLVLIHSWPWSWVLPASLD